MRYLMMILTVLFLGAGCTIQQSNENGEDDMGPTQGKIGWSQSGALIAGIPNVSVVSIQANFPEAANYTCQFRLGGNLTSKKTQAEITWVVEGTPIRRLVTVADGVSVQGAAQAVSVRVTDVSVLDALPAVKGQAYNVYINVTKGTRGSTSNPPTFTPENLLQLVPLTSHTYIVPQSAGIISVAFQLYNILNGPVAGGDIAVQCFDDAGNNLATFDPTLYFWQPFPAGCTQITVTNNAAGKSYYVKPIYGIDG